ncbi:TrmH family RNA methyltransferase [Acrocarpospora catenulata]|uniref:TrmH family RNA methyltransferase n=1 Tax=Acrocarpospora catenulata TaxID=2836182 RepID=UPI001BDB65EA|nr:TrmH family RNA methyltransferase [Acrocarpospora catenulata]
MSTVQRITTRNARFQQWQSLLTNRNKRSRAGEFLVQGVRPISLAVQYGWPVHALIYDAERKPSKWLEELLGTVRADLIAMAPEMVAELGEKNEAPPEVVAVVEMPADDLGRIPVEDDFLGVVLDRPTSPGNIGSIIRSADALGAHGLIVAGHAADVYDPKSVRASTGSLFFLPAVRVPAPSDVVAWVAAQRDRGKPIVVVGTDEHGDCDVFDFDFTQPTLLLIGNETSGLSGAWREACDFMVSIPMVGAASSLNAANAATALLYEASRQRITVAGSGRLPRGRRR